MTLHDPRRRRLAAVAARAGLIGSTVMVLISASGLLPAGVTVAGAAGTQVGTAGIVKPNDGTPGGGTTLTGGGSATPFTLLLGPGTPSCPGDSANDGYLVMSFMVPAAADVSALQFDLTLGPTPLATGAGFRQPLYEVGSGSTYVARQTANADTAGGPGTIVEFPAFDLTGFTATTLPAGQYALGFACTLGVPSATQMKSYWVGHIEVKADTQDPGGFTWKVVDTPSVVTTTTAASGASTTSTTASGGSTTTAAGGSTTTTTRPTGATSTSTAAAAAGTTSGGPSSSSPGTGLPATGGSPLGLLMWSIVLLVCGRIAVVLGRPPKVPTAG